MRLPVTPPPRTALRSCSAQVADQPSRLDIVLADKAHRVHGRELQSSWVDRVQHSLAFGLPLLNPANRAVAASPRLKLLLWQADGHCPSRVDIPFDPDTRKDSPPRLLHDFLEPGRDLKMLNEHGRTWSDDPELGKSGRRGKEERGENAHYCPE